MEELIFATNNQKKIDEIKPVTNGLVKIITLREAGIDQEIEEPYETLHENALEKAKVIHNLTGKNVFSEDTGLSVDALNGAPGVKSARYADGETDFGDNIDKLLFHLKNKSDKTARFTTVICLIKDGETHYFEGVCEGTIINERSGQLGFGYDPVFIPDGSTKTFAQMEPHEKNIYSHRKKAVDKLLSFLLKSYGKN